MTMKMNNRYFDSAKSRARWVKSRLKDKDQRKELEELIDDIDKGIFVGQKRFDEQEMWAIRNPGFPGDEMGRPDDDFFDDEEEDEDDKKQ
jgi:hypothetical protein